MVLQDGNACTRMPKGFSAEKYDPQAATSKQTLRGNPAGRFAFGEMRENHFTTLRVLVLELKKSSDTSALGIIGGNFLRPF